MAMFADPFWFVTPVCPSAPAAGAIPKVVLNCVPFKNAGLVTPPAFQEALSELPELIVANPSGFEVLVREWV
jgi:hypothetical protein